MFAVPLHRQGAANRAGEPKRNSTTVLHIPLWPPVPVCGRLPEQEMEKPK